MKHMESSQEKKKTIIDKNSVKENSPEQEIKKKLLFENGYQTRIRTPVLSDVYNDQRGTYH